MIEKKELFSSEEDRIERVMYQARLSIGEEDHADADAESSDMNTDEATIDEDSEESDANLTIGCDSSFDSANVSNLDNECENEEEIILARKSGPAILARKKQRKCRTSFSKSQIDALEREFERSNFITKDRLDHLLTTTGLEPVIIKVLFDHSSWSAFSRILLNKSLVSELVQKQAVKSGRRLPVFEGQ